MDALSRARPIELLVHLRPHFQLLLAPIFLWAALLAGGALDARLAIAFVVVHLFLYGGITAFNSAYDRDEGPVGGLEHPPQVSSALLPFAVAVKLAGWGLAFLIDFAFFVLYGLIAALSVAYSYPGIRFKARVWPSLTTVAAGQGILAFLAAWAVVRGEVGSALTGWGLAGALAATCLVLGFYPLTQLYQVEEDRRRGDQSVPVAWGAAGAFRLSLGCFAVGGAALVAVVAARFTVLEAGVLGGFVLALLAIVGLWSGRYRTDEVVGNYRRVMRLNAVAAVGFSVYLLVRLLLEG